MQGWHDLLSTEQVDQAVQNSAHKPVVFFKHSIRCSISTMAMNRLKNLDQSALEKADFYYLDLIAHRPVSNYIAEKLQVYHESPQIIVVKNGECTYDASHMEISPKDLLQEL